MDLQIRTVRLGSPRDPNEGLRIGTVRWLPRGVPKTDYARRNYFDVWVPTLAPSEELLRKFQDGGMALRSFFQRYRSEMKKKDPRQIIILLAELAKRTPISIGCYCENESQCHRSVLIELIRAAAESAGSK
jgi:uncharacterized protein YeaO (DUF488 family)